MSNRSRNFRRRADDDDDDDNNNTPASSTPVTSTKKTQSKPTTTATKPKKPAHQPPKSLLSFADDEDDDERTTTIVSRPASRPSTSSRFSKTPSTSSHKLTSKKERITPSSTPLPSNVQPQAGTYTKEALLELQKNTKTLGSTSRSRPEPTVILKGLVKPDPVDQADDLENERNKDDAMAKLGSLGLGLGKVGKGDGSIIPDQAMINAIRAKRERLRQSRAAAPDYIALDGGSNHGETEGLSEEEPEFQGRIALIGEKVDSKKGVFEDTNVKLVDSEVGRKVIEVNGDDSIDEEDEEDKMWEEEQFRKGLGKRMDDGASRVAVSTSSVPLVQTVVQQAVVYPSAAPVSYPSIPSGLGIGGAVGWYAGSNVMSLSQQAELSKKALNESVMRLKESHGRTLTSLTKTDENLSDSLLKVTALESSLSAAGEKFIFMQKLRDFVSVICDFLQDKAPFIEELEYQMQKLHEERAASIIERRAADNNDEMMELEAAVNAAMMVFSKGGNSASVVEAATAAAQVALAASRESRNLPVKLDEFGRDMNLKNRMDMTRRAEARQRRKARSESKRMSSMENDSSYQRIEGESSTDESDSESTAYQSNRDQLLQIAGQIFSDAAEEYSQLSSVKEMFETWKKKYSLSYRDAYMSLSVPAIFSPYVRLELLKWDPLHEDSDFFDMKWHSLLFDFGLPQDGTESSDADANLVPDLVEKVAIPILHHEIAHCWDILSTTETKYAVVATDLVLRYVSHSSNALGDLVAVLRERLADAVANLMLPTWNILVTKAVPNAARVAAYRFGMSVRLMRNICLWNNILSTPVLEKLALDELLTGKVLPHLRSIQSNLHDAVTRTERIVASLSGVWTGPSVSGERSPRLQPLVDFLLGLGKSLEKKHGSRGLEAGASGLARRLKKMLVELNEYDHARAMSRTFNLKEAL